MDRLRNGSCQKGTYSIGGIHGVPEIQLVMASTPRMTTMPSQKDGVAMPATATVRTTTSIQLFCFSAERVPSGMAMAIATTVASTAISIDTGRRTAISSATGFPDHI